MSAVKAEAVLIFDEVITAIKQVSDLLIQEIELNYKFKDVGMRMIDIWHDTSIKF